MAITDSDVREVAAPASPPEDPPNLKLIYRDRWMAAIDKPAGLAVHRSKRVRERETCLNLLSRQLQCWVQPVHRLDRPTSGVLLFALDGETSRRLFATFQGRAADKRYLALVRGWPESEGVIERPLRKVRKGPRLPAETRYRTLATTEIPYAVGPYAQTRYALVELTPRTGKLHQLRRHLRWISHPILGDTNYGDRDHNRFLRETFGIEEMMLAAVRLRVPHPWSGAPLRIDAPPSPAFRALAERVGLDGALADWLAASQ